MRSNYLKATLKTALFAVTILLLAAGVSFAQVGLTAQETTIALPDGQLVPMWGLFCTGATGATCTAMNGTAQGGASWQPPLIVAHTGDSLTINLTNSLPTGVPTSLVIVGQLGGGLGATPTRVPSPAHAAQGPTWPISGTAAAGPAFAPPNQAGRVQSFGTEVGTGATTALTWTGLKAGTYLLESGTHPSIQGPMGLYGVLVVTDTTTTPLATAYPVAGAIGAVTYDADLPLLLSEIDPVQNTAVFVAVHSTGFSETAVWSGVAGACGDPTVHSCYPPAVNYDPRYYLVNGAAFDKTTLTNSTFAVTAPAGTGKVLVRFVNAGLRMHIPSIVGAQTGAPAVPGFSLIAEDGNVLPGTPRVQSEVFLAAGKTHDVMVNAPAAGAPALPVFDRQLSLSTNNQRDGGMQAYISVNSGAVPVSGITAAAVNDSYFLVAGNTLTVSDVAKGVIANDVNVYGVSLVSGGTSGQLTLNADGTFTYVPNAGTTSDSFVYQANGLTGPTATVTLGACTGTCLGAAPVAQNDNYPSNTAISTQVQIRRPGVLANDSDPDGHPLKAVLIGAGSCSAVDLKEDGSFTARTAGTTCSFTYNAVNSQNTASPATVTITFPTASGLVVNVVDPTTNTAITDYRWIIEEDRTFRIDPACQINTGTGARPAGCPPLPVPSLGTNFHTSHMPLVAAGCVGVVACEDGQTVLDSGTHAPAACDGNGVCTAGPTQKTPVNPSEVHLDPLKHYFISVLPGDGANGFISGAGGPVPVNPGNPNGAQRPFDVTKDCDSFTPGTGTCGHTMGGSAIAPGQLAVTINVEPTPLPTAKIAVFVFEDDFPLNGENDAGGGADALATNETGLGGFEIVLMDQAGGFGDSTGQPTYDMFNMPLSNSLAGTPDPLHPGNDACPITGRTDGLVGMIVTCPHFESDNVTVSPLEGQAVISNLYPGLYEVVATPGADRIALGEEWLQTNTLDGTKSHEAFVKAGEPAYFQEFGPAGYHVLIGFANPAIINGRRPGICASATAHCTNTVTGRVTTARISRSPDERIYSSGSYDANGYTQCYVSLGDPDEEDFAFTKCDANGGFSFTGIPDGNWRITIFDQWNDLLVDGLSVPVAVSGGTVNMGDVPMQQWRTNLYNRTYIDTNGNGVPDDGEPGLPLVPINVRFRDGSFSNFNNTDLAGAAGFNEIFPYFNWLVVEADTTRYKQTGVHVVYDAGGPADGTPGGGTSAVAAGLANTLETVHLPSNLRVPGAVYCANADCSGASIATGAGNSPTPSTGRIDPPWVTTEGWQGFIGQSEFVEFGKQPFAEGENGGIHGNVHYMSTRPFDDPSLLLQLSWTPGVPNVTINLYQKGTAPDGTDSLRLVDTTQTSSWDDWAQGFRSNGVPNMNCPGQATATPFFFTLQNSTQWLNPGTPLPNSSQYKCYDGMHMFNQVQPAPYDGMYKFPSVTGTSPTTGRPLAGAAGTSCTICTANPVDGLPMLPAGKYVVEVVVPPGLELVKEEDKNILIGDNYIAPVAQQFGGLGSIFILPDQASVSAYNPNNPINATTDLGVQPRHEGDTGSVETFWPCVGQARVVPDFISLFPGSGENSPFAGATRNLCDRKEVTLEDQMSVLAKFYVFSSTHLAAHFSGIITDDFSSEFDPFSPQFGEKFAVPNLPISFKDFNGYEISRTYSDQWGFFDGLNYSTWEVNPPNPTGYAPTMMVTCMNDPGPIPGPNGTMITDPLYNPHYSQFCYEWAFMPGQTAYMDTPVVPTAAFAEGYNPVDCAYPDATPAIASVIGDSNGGGAGPWVSVAGHSLTITALGDQLVNNNAYSGPRASAAPFNQKTITRHYGFGASQGTGSVTIAGVNAPVTSWSDTQIVVTVPSLTPAQSTCTIGQRGVTGTNLANYRCGELVITAGNRKKSIDTVTVTVAGKPPTYINGENASNTAIQTAIDGAVAGDLIIVGPGTYNEMLLMWKPVRLQGVGAASVKVNANTHPSGRIDTWRRKVDCLFGLSLNGGLISADNPFDPGNNFSCSTAMRGQVDPIPGEPVVGWDPTLNGNIAELLQEPTLMGAYEGAGITVLAKGVREVQPDPNCFGLNGICTPLTASNADCNAWHSNFLCNPARIDGLSFVNSSAGGGGIFVHGWNHSMEVSNNRVYANVGTLTGGITIGQMETTDGTIVGTQQQAFGYNQNVRLHNNSVTQNASFGDELNSTSPEAAGGVTICTGADNYRFNFNWVCGNLSTGDGGGFAQFGFTYNGNVSNNWFLFNQSANPTIPANGGGILVAGAPPDGTICETTVTDMDCPPQLSDGAGPGLVIDSNLIMGNTAESGSGGGIRFQSVNGTEIALNPTNPGNWYAVTVTNNIISNNVAGWDGGGISLQDALRVSFINNTVVSNDVTASAGVLFNTIGAAAANTPPPGCSPNPDPTQPQDPSCVNPVLTSTPQAAGLVSSRHTSNLIASLPATMTCPAGYPAPLSNGICRSVSYPILRNDMFWQNRAFNITVGGFGAATLSQQHLVTLVPTLNQATTGQCPTTGANGGAGPSYWDIGIRGDTAPNNHSSGFTLGPVNSILTNFSGSYAGNGNIAPASAGVVTQYCNGARVPPENGGFGFDVPPGISDATLPNPVFSLTPAATVDEGNNWVNMAYGPLTLTNLSGAMLADYSIAPGSPAFNAASATGAPNHDFFGTTRPQGGAFDIGAVELAVVTAPIASVTGGPLAFGSVATGTTSPSRQLVLHNTGNANLTGITLVFASTGTAPPRFTRPAGVAGGTCAATLTPALGTCTINVVFSPNAIAAFTGTLTITANVAVTGSPVGLSGTGAAPVVSAALAPATWSPSATRGVGLVGPVQIFALTNTGNVTLTGIAQGALGGTNAADYAIVRLTSTCGPTGGGQALGQTTLVPGASCVVTVQFRPRAAPQPTGLKPATVSVTDAAGTQVSTLNGTAN